MSFKRYPNGNSVRDIKSGVPCPICNNKMGRCGIFSDKDNNVIAYICKHVTSDKPFKGWDGWYMHKTADTKPVDKNMIKDEAINIDWNLRFSVYKNLMTLIRENINLYELDLKILKNRGLSEEEVAELGLFSVPNLYDSKKIIKALEDKYKDKLLEVPGFYKNKYGTQMINYPGVFIPYEDINGNVQGFQIRLNNPITDTNNKTVRYIWFSSKNNSSGAFIGYFCPPKINNENIFLLVEGGLKGRIAALKTGLQTLYMAGVSSYGKLSNTAAMVKKNNCPDLKCIIALDMDKYVNQDVLRSEEKLINLLSIHNIPACIAEWNVRINIKDIDFDKFNSSKNELNRIAPKNKLKNIANIEILGVSSKELINDIVDILKNGIVPKGVYADIDIKGIDEAAINKVNYILKECY